MNSLLLNDLQHVYKMRKNEIKNRLDEFSEPKSKGEVFMEMCFCLLTPQSNARRCWDTILELKKNELLYDGKEDSMINRMTGCRFHNTKAKYVVAVREKFDSIYEKIKTTESTQELREWLVQNVKGYGYKEASHFMRNIGSRDVSILDRHILRNMVKFGLLDEIPKTLTKKKYLEIEQKFFEFSKTVDIDPAELDLLIWSMQTGNVFK